MGSKLEPEPSPPSQVVFSVPHATPALLLSAGLCHSAPHLPLSLLQHVPQAHVEAEGTNMQT